MKSIKYIKQQKTEKTMTNYSNSKVYKLVNSIDRKIYVGSTTQPLSQRLSEHKRDAKRRSYYVYQHLNKIGWDTVRIILIETVNCFNKEQLTQREQHYIDLLKPALNKQAAYVNCPHGRIHSKCKECHGAGICPHNIEKATCKICGGAAICEHNMRKSQCIKCGGSNICKHNKQKLFCKICSPKYCQFCDITLSKGNFKPHTQSKNHIHNFIHS